MKELLSVVALSTLLIAAKADDYVESNAFAGDDMHTFPEKNGRVWAGIIVGGVLIVVFWFYTAISIIADEIKRHKDYDQQLEDDRREIQRLNLDQAAIDTEY